LRTNLTATDPAVLWKQYIQLTEAEWAFRIAKDELDSPDLSQVGGGLNSPVFGPARGQRSPLQRQWR
jgi:hypothetical protein